MFRINEGKSRIMHMLLTLGWRLQFDECTMEIIELIEMHTAWIKGDVVVHEKEKSKLQRFSEFFNLEGKLNY